MGKPESCNITEVALKMIGRLRIRPSMVVDDTDPQTTSIRAFWHNLENLPPEDDDIRVSVLELGWFFTLMNLMDPGTLGQIADQGVSKMESSRSGKTSLSSVHIVRVFKGKYDTGHRRLLELAAQAVVAEMYDILCTRVVHPPLRLPKKVLEEIDRTSSKCPTPDADGSY